MVAEDDNLVQVANGFFYGMSGDRRIHIEPVEGPRRSGHGWSGAVRTVPNYNLGRSQGRHLLLLVDFDNDPGFRLAGIRRQLDELGQSSVLDRIYVIGVFRQSEDLERNGLSYFDFGVEVARFCRGESFEDRWQNASLAFNRGELLRLQKTVCANFCDLRSVRAGKNTEES